MAVRVVSFDWYILAWVELTSMVVYAGKLADLLCVSNKGACRGIACLPTKYPFLCFWSKYS